MPANYDFASMSVQPESLFHSGREMAEQSMEVYRSILRILEHLKGLKLSWAGRSSDEAEDFGRRWVEAVSVFFSDSSESRPGVLDTMAGGLKVAAVAYGNNEHDILTAFDQFGSALATTTLTGQVSDMTGSKGTGGPPQDTAYDPYRVIVEDYPS